MEGGGALEGSMRRSLASIIQSLVLASAVSALARAETSNSLWLFERGGDGNGELVRVPACPNGTLAEEARGDLGKICSRVDRVTSCPRGYVWPAPGEQAKVCRPIASRDEAAESEANFQKARRTGVAPVERDGSPVFPRIMEPAAPGQDYSGSHWVRLKKCPAGKILALSHRPKLGDMECVDPEEFAAREEKAKEDCEANGDNPNGYCIKEYKPQEWIDPEALMKPVVPTDEDCRRQAYRSQTLDPACLRERGRRTDRDEEAREPEAP